MNSSVLCSLHYTLLYQIFVNFPNLLEKENLSIDPTPELTQESASSDSFHKSVA